MYEQACTTILVGKKATVDGSTMIARNDDTFMPITPQKFIVHPAVHGRNETLTSGKNGFTAPLPADGYRYQAVFSVPDACPSASGNDFYWRYLLSPAPLRRDA